VCDFNAWANPEENTIERKTLLFGIEEWKALVPPLLLEFVA